MSILPTGPSRVGAHHPSFGEIDLASEMPYTIPQTNRSIPKLIEVISCSVTER
jgi:hypothetical protein